VTFYGGDAAEIRKRHCGEGEVIGKEKKADVGVDAVEMIVNDHQQGFALRSSNASIL